VTSNRQFDSNQISNSVKTDEYLLEEQSCQTSSRSDLKRWSLGVRLMPGFHHSVAVLPFRSYRWCCR